MLDFFIQFFTDLLNVLKGQKQEIDRPNELKPDQGFIMPEIIRVPGIKFNLHGQYKTKTGNAKGLIVHYTVSGREEKDARSVLAYLAKNGLGCMVMDKSGKIYIAENVDLQKSVAWHAGTSSIYGVSGLSQYCMGMEICCWGRLDQTTLKKASGIIVEVVRKEANMAPGSYEAYTKEQEKSLVNFCLWQKSVNPEFDFDWVLGHDEIAPTRKTDPGGSLSVTMPVFRNMLKSR